MTDTILNGHRKWDKFKSILGVEEGVKMKHLYLEEEYKDGLSKKQTSPLQTFWIHIVKA